MSDLTDYNKPFEDWVREQQSRGRSKNVGREMRAHVQNDVEQIPMDVALDIGVDERLANEGSRVRRRDWRAYFSGEPESKGEGGGGGGSAGDDEDAGGAAGGAAGGRRSSRKRRRHRKRKSIKRRRRHRTHRKK